MSDMRHSWLRDLGLEDTGGVDHLGGALYEHELSGSFVHVWHTEGSDRCEVRVECAEVVILLDDYVYSTGISASIRQRKGMRPKFAASSEVSTDDFRRVAKACELAADIADRWNSMMGS